MFNIIHMHVMFRLVGGMHPPHPPPKSATGDKSPHPSRVSAPLFTKLLWPGDSEGTFRSSSQAATCLPHTANASNCLFIAERQAEKLLIPVFCLWFNPEGIKLRFTASVADALSTWPLIGNEMVNVCD